MSTPAPEPRTSGDPAAPDEIALAPQLRMRLLGAGLVAIGTVVLVALILSLVVKALAPVLTGLVVLATVGVLVLGVLLGVRHWVVRLDDLGYRVRALRSARTRNARWTDVLDLQTSTVGGARCVVLRLRDGSTTTIPVDVLEGSSEAFIELLQARLDRGHGYRRLR